MKQESFFIIFKGLSLKQTKQIFLEGKSPTLNTSFMHGGLVLLGNLDNIELIIYSKRQFTVS